MVVTNLHADFDIIWAKLHQEDPYEYAYIPYYTTINNIISQLTKTRANGTWRGSTIFINPTTKLVRDTKWIHAIEMVAKGSTNYNSCKLSLGELKIVIFSKYMPAIKDTFFFSHWVILHYSSSDDNYDRLECYQVDEKYKIESNLLG